MHDGSERNDSSAAKGVIGAQLDLWQLEVDVLPWGGRSPRSLTKAQISLFLKRERQERERFFADPSQVDMFRRRRKKAPREYLGAPSLVPLPRRGDERR